MSRDDQYEHDVTEAGRRAAHMRHAGDLGRVLWLLNEKLSWALEIEAETIAEIRELKAKVAEIKATLDAGVPVDLGPTNALLTEILNFLIGKSGQAESLDLSFGTPEPQ